VVVLVEDAARTWVSAEVEPGDLDWIGDRLWQRLLWSVVVVEPFVFAECVE
jgi:hypothetical protein